jgi:hypothetical protein
MEEIMKEIELTRGYKAIVDDEDFERVSQYKWIANVDTHTCYATRNMYVGNVDGRSIFEALPLANFILGVKGQVDHKDRNGLNCQKGNLRPCSTSQNSANRGKFKTRRFSSEYKGVSKHISEYTGLVSFRAVVRVNGVLKEFRIL